jgi:hypothetical protein
MGGPVRRVLLALAGVATGTVLLVCAKGPFPIVQSIVADAPPDPGADDGRDGATSCPSSGPSASLSPRTSASGSTSVRGTVEPRVVAGPVVTHKYGPVQVQVTVLGDRITDIVELKLPDTGGRGVQINTRVVPRLRTQALVAQSADIDTVSGATLTSRAYQESLQAALDAAAGGHWGCPPPQR